MSLNRLKYFVALTVVFCLFNAVAGAVAADEIDDELAMYAEENDEILDPLEPLNRFFFQFNDKMYFYVLKPVATGYGAVLPEDIRVSIGNAFHNILAPIRIINNLLQGKFAESGTEVLRFVINTTAGAGGFGDPAKEVFHLDKEDEDLGQTLGRYGVGEGIYFCWPFLGPSNLRDTVGFVGDSFLNPLAYIASSDTQSGIGLQAGKMVNKTSLYIGEYEQFIETSFDPYVAMRDFYTQSRRDKIKDEVEDGGVDNDLGVNMGEVIIPIHIAEEPKNIVKLNNEVIKIVPDSISVHSKQYFVQVFVSDDMESIEPMIDKLVDLEKDPIVVQFQQDSHNYYGLMVLVVGESQLAALAEEAMLAENGFADASVVRL